jgi:DNA-binding beta-propeller fold protein YncE
MEVRCAVSPRVADAIAALGRTEDVRFSPNNRRLAVAAFTRNRVAVLDIDIAMSGVGARVALTGGVQLSSSALKYPHGLDFIDDDTVLVANRAGDVAIFKLPAGGVDARSCDVAPIQTWAAGGTSFLRAPGSVTVTRVGRDRREILICNNSGNSVTRHLLDVGAGCVVRSSEVLLRRWLDVPDGVAVSPDRQWIAVSNHGTHNVLLYENGPALNEHADPDGILRRVHYPHGLRFSSDGGHLFVADAGSPDVHVYAEDGAGWRGVRDPAATITVMDESQFRSGQHNPQEGGPKGLDLDAGSNVLVVTSECQPLAFFDVRAMLERASVGNPDGEPDERSQRELRAREVSYELSIMEYSDAMRARIMEREAEVAYLRNSWSWRITAPLRRLYAALQRFR